MENCILFAPSVRPFHRVPAALLKKLRRRHPDCRLVLLMTDSIERVAWGNGCSVQDVLDFMRQFDASFSYDRHDAEKYGCRFVEIPLWHDANAAAVETEYDVLFCGHPKQRETMINAIIERLQSDGRPSFKFIISGNPEKALSDRVSIQSWRPYTQLAEEITKSRCILEIMADMNTGTTLRYKEAIMYNKKLLTNNPDLPELPYYDPRWMKHFGDASDIDIDWLCKDEPVDYGYSGDFSAERFLSSVETALREENLL